MWCNLFILALGLNLVSSQEMDIMSSFRLWEHRRSEFLSRMKPVGYCFTENRGTEVMKVINSQQCSVVGLPLDDAIRIEYDNWLSEDWFPNDQELEDMRLDDVM